MATDENRSLSQGIAIPQWMKSKITDHKLDMETANFSPTELDDSFFYIRYPRALSEPVEPPPQQQQSQQNTMQPPSSAPISDAIKKPDFSKHTIPCQRFLAEKAGQFFRNANNGIIKSNGTDDGFKGEAAECGSSVIKVAHQMVSGKLIRGPDDPDRPPNGFNPMIRRGSKSLPSSPMASPNTSPKSKRRLTNKYFTGPFAEDGDRNKGNWILSSLLGRRSMSQSVNMIAEETDSGMQNASSEASIDSIQGVKSKKQILRPKPSELREMNFWSPTSM